MKKLIVLITIVLAQTSHAQVASGSDNWSSAECTDQSRVLVDCGKHEITLMGTGIKPVRSIINCGRPGLTKNGRGKIGEFHTPLNSSVVGNAINITGISGMGMPPYGNGEVFHVTPPFNSNNHPSRQNKSAGCIHIEKDVLEKLAQCEGASLEIMNASDGGSNAAPYEAPPTWTMPDEIGGGSGSTR